MDEIYSYTDYRLYLKDYLSMKKSTKAALGLRVFAKKFKLSPSHLSLVLSGKKGLSENAAFFVCDSLKLPVDETEYFLLMVAYDNAPKTYKPNLMKRMKILRAKRNSVKMSLNSMSTKFNWIYLLALVASVSTKIKRKEVVSFISKCGNINSKEANRIIDDLKGQGLLQEESDLLFRSDKNVVFETDKDHGVMKSIHEGFLKKCIELLQEKSALERYSVTEFVYISPANFEQLKNMTNDYLDEITQISDQTSEDLKMLGICLHLNFM